MTEIDHQDLPMLTDSPVDHYEGMTEQEIQRTIYMNKFNAVILAVFNHVSQFYANAEITTARDQIDEVLMESPEGPICCFLKYVYMNDEYRRNLQDMNESFFLNSQRINDPEVARDQAIIEKIFSFKKVWTQFSRDTKNFILRAMKGLVAISTRYIEYMD